MVTKLKIFHEEIHLARSTEDIESAVNDFIKDKKPPLQKQGLFHTIDKV